MKNNNVRNGLLFVLVLILVVVCPFAGTTQKQLCRFDVARGLWKETMVDITSDGLASFYINIYNFTAVARVIGMDGTPPSMIYVGEYIKRIGGSVTGNPKAGYQKVSMDLGKIFPGECKPGDGYPREALPYDDDKSITSNSELSLSNLALGALLLGSILGGFALGGRIFGRRTAPSGA